jgi:hypothetical protein
MVPTLYVDLKALISQAYIYIYRHANAYLPRQAKSQHTKWPRTVMSNRPLKIQIKQYNELRRGIDVC